jgi:hypothetical protein
MSTFELVESGIEVVDVGLMMLFVMGLQQLAAQDGLQGRVAILEVRKGDLASFSCESMEHSSRDLGTKHQN